MNAVDLVLLLLLFVVEPVWGVYKVRSVDARVAAGRHVDRLRFYRHTAILEWLFLAALGVAWFSLERPVENLGFVPPGGPGFWVGMILVMLGTGVLVRSWRQAKTADDDDKVRVRESLGRLVHFLPHSRHELRSFYRVSLTAGIVEEIIYRGFVLWLLDQYMPLWGAVVVSSIGFGLCHSYQGASGVIRTGLVGLAFAMLYVGSGSIWLPIIAHALLDMLQGAALYEILREDDDPAKRQMLRQNPTT